MNGDTGGGICRRSGYRGFIASPFVLASLPLRDIKKGEFVRKYNDVQLHITGYPKVPYGKYARYMLILMTTHCVLSEAKEGESVVLEYSSLQQCLDELMLERQRGKELKEQIEYFARSSFIFEQKIKKVNVEGKEIENVMVANVPFMDYCSYTDVAEDENKRNLTLKVIMGPRFVELCRKHSVPVNYSVYREISGSLEKDIYVWLTYRNHILGSDEVLEVSREMLVNQFNPVESNDSKQIINAWAYLRNKFEEVRSKWGAELKLECGKNGIKLRKSMDVIMEKDRRYVLINKGGIDD